jgi:hypothetical protein
VIWDYKEWLLNICQKQENIVQLNVAVNSNSIVNISNPINESKKKKRIDTITAECLALFCSIMHQSKILPQKFDESKEGFCSRVLGKFELQGNPNKIRGIYTPAMEIKANDINLIKVTELILPGILDVEIKKTVTEFINNKTNLYA